MALKAPFLALLGLGFFALATTSPSGSAVPGAVTGGTITVKPGSTWMLTMKAVGGGKFGEAEEAQMRAMMPQVGILQSYLASRDGDTLVVVITYDKATTLTLGQLIGLTTTPGKGIMITEAMPLPDGGPKLPGDAPPPLL